MGKQASLEPEEIPDAEHELIIERVAAIDVAKESGKVCVRASKDAAGRRSGRRELSENRTVVHDSTVERAYLGRQWW